MPAGPIEAPRFDLPLPSARPIPQAFLVLYAIALGLGLGLGSASFATKEAYPLGGVKAGPWTAWPRIGARDADPYVKAIDARTATIPLALGEGLMITATRDGTGQPLEARCTYRVGGNVPTARAWTLTVYDQAGRLASGGRSGFTSAEILREMDGSFGMALSRGAQPGNWLPLPAAGRVTLVLRLYDTPASSTASALDPRALPAITRLDCAA